MAGFMYGEGLRVDICWGLNLLFDEWLDNDVLLLGIGIEWFGFFDYLVIRAFWQKDGCYDKGTECCG